ncbi:BgTH12-00310 [Blumeria graminis f. sp. triticale]|uniref:Mitochondrial import receptor subunit TOM20 n=3 Tax=Blumeria graminis TaxID=34373 RepID=A0A9X9QF33_BLUGR|nr:Component of the TOM (translocase of outer membrane) complex [Blumeria graminis f. sp. tritici 96224]CAD6504807.1 BgTH12-00310 [Blumeria graminis f. sp. triticale]VDB92829.1 Bgt-3296 [Blumeria graminis f. sp. tritici]
MGPSNFAFTTTFGTIATCLIAYVVYFDYRRRNDPQFRKQLKKDLKKQAKAAKELAEIQVAQQRKAIRVAVEEAKLEGFPTDVEEREGYFMQEIAKGEGLSSDGSASQEAALCFYKALKVYPSPPDLISIYDKTVPKAILDILAEMIAADSSMSVNPLKAELDNEKGLD